MFYTCSIPNMNKPKNEPNRIQPHISADKYAYIKFGQSLQSGLPSEFKWSVISTINATAGSASPYSNCFLASPICAMWQTHPSTSHGAWHGLARYFPGIQCFYLWKVVLYIHIAKKKYHLVMTNIAMERSTIFKNGKPSISMGHLYHGELLVITRG